jgi:hypothetical protein
MSEQIQLRHGLTAVYLTHAEAEERAAQHPTLFDCGPEHQREGDPT